MKRNLIGLIVPMSLVHISVTDIRSFNFFVLLNLLIHLSVLIWTFKSLFVRITVQISELSSYVFSSLSPFTFRHLSSFFYSLLFFLHFFLFHTNNRRGVYISVLPLLFYNDQFFLNSISTRLGYSRVWCYPKINLYPRLLFHILFQ